MMTTQQIQDLLCRVSYKPGWQFRVYDGRFEGQHFVITTQVPDAFNPGFDTTLDVHSALPPCRDEQAFLDWLLWRTARIEVHEAMEFLQVDGHPHVDPHRFEADHDL
jgi:hypothetical protein